MANPMVVMVYDASVLKRFRDVLVGTRSSLVAQMDNLTWLWAKSVSGVRITDILSDNFQLIWQQGQTQWVRPSEAYIKRKQDQGYSPMTLVRSGRLYNALTTPGGTEDTISYGDARNYYYGVNTEAFRNAGGWSYPEIHNHLGDAAGNVRPFIYIHPLIWQKLNAWLWRGVREMIMGTVQRSGLKGVTVT